MDTDTLTVEQLSRRWRASTQTVLRLAKAGRIPGTFRSGRRYLFAIAKIKSFEEEGSKE